MDFIRWSKQEAHVLYRYIKDVLSRERFCRKSNKSIDLPYSIEVTQPFTHSSTLKEKKHNLSLAGDRIRRYIINPGEVFSFWRCVGNPNSNAFASSRGIRGGVLQLERGGGLCQASGIIHHLSLLCGFDIIERYNHSKDLYTDETRFCPLGSDATVAYGYRDLRIKNTSNSQIQIDLQVHDDHFSGYLRSSNQIKTLDIIFESIETTDGNIIAKTIDKADGRLIEISHYERLK